MNDNDKERFSSALVAASFAIPRDVSKPMLTAYYNLLSDLDISDIEIAIENHCRVSQFYPKPADIRNIINGGKPNSKDKALLAWVSIIDAMKKKGAYRSLTLDDRLAMQIVNHVGGYVNLCSLSYKDLEFKKREFIEAYTTTEKVDDNLLPKSLKGLHEQRANQLKIESK